MSEDRTGDNLTRLPDEGRPPALTAAERALLESGLREAYHHEFPRRGKACSWCADWRTYDGGLMSELEDTIRVALAHGHSITIVPHPADINAGVVLGDDASGRCMHRPGHGEQNH